MDRHDLRDGALAGEAGEETSDLLPPVDRVQCRPLAATAIGVEHGVLGQEPRQGRHLATACRAKEGPGQSLAHLGRGDKARPGFAQMHSGAGGKLAAGRLAAAERGGDLGEIEIEHIVQQEGGALQGREPLQCQHQCEREIARPLFCARRVAERLAVQHRLG